MIRQTRLPRSTMTSFAYQSDNRFLKVPAPRAASPMPWPALPGTAPPPTGPARASGRAPSARPATCCATACTRCSTSAPTGMLGDAGDLPLPNTSLEGMRAAMPPLVDALIRRHHMAWLGGDHSITLPLLRCYRRWLGRPLAVIHFDAHCDTWSDHFGEPSGHGTWVYEAMQEGLVINECFMQLGIRSAGVREAREYVREQGGLIFDARSLRGLESAAQLAPVLATMRERLARHGNPPLYLSLDIDALDPAFAPGTGTPEPGGLTHQPGVHRAGGIGRPALRRHGLRGGGPALRPCRAEQLCRRALRLDLPVRLHRPRRLGARPDGRRYSASAVVFFTVRSTSIEFERATPGRRISTSVWKRSRSSASR